MVQVAISCFFFSFSYFYEISFRWYYVAYHRGGGAGTARFIVGFGPGGGGGGGAFLGNWFLGIVTGCPGDCRCCVCGGCGDERIGATAGDGDAALEREYSFFAREDDNG